MKKLMVFAIILMLSPRPAWADSTWAVLQQTSIQTAEHLKRVQEAIKMVQLLQTQVHDVQDLLKLAVRASEGLEGVEFISDFRNLAIETNDLIGEIREYIEYDKPIGEEWLNLFGKIGNWIEDSNEIFKNIKMSDSVNARSFNIADSYHDKYQENSEYAEQLVANSKTVNEKGALKQIAEEMGHLMQMQNQEIYLLSEILRSQSVEYSNENLKRKEDAIKFEQENKGIKRFISMSIDDQFEL